MFLSVVNTQQIVRCRYCLQLVTDTSVGCLPCKNRNESTEKASILRRLVNSFRREMSSELVVLNFEDPDQLFADHEIDSLLNNDRMRALNLKDVPNWDLMFFNTKRITKPGRKVTGDK